ncbi:5'-nucleotidase [Archangium primigenium]|uniref:5'-nucleotidase n=1 Tax=[Archangium] primigenium TaxID=2792470 RepID=UPI001EF7D6B5|nr:5'-nucleotidase [Archangium primigenium]
MRVRSALRILWVSGLLAAGVEAAPREAVVLFTGDNAGEISDCGCRQGPAGGLARRKTVIDRERAGTAAVVVLDAGNALFKTPDAGRAPGDRERAALLLEQMGEMGTQAMAVGERDLALGTGFLTQGARKRKLVLLSANLTDAAGAPVFARSRVVRDKGVAFGLIGVSPEGPVAGEARVVGQPVLPAVQAEARALRAKQKVDVVVVLAALPLAEARALTERLGAEVDFVLQSHEGRLPGVAQHPGQGTLVSSGERGRQVGRLALSIDGPGAFVDLAERERARQGLALLEENIQRGRARLTAARDETNRAALQQSLAALEARRPQLEAQARPPETAPARTQLLSFLPLGPEVPEDPELTQRVAPLLPPSARP